MRNRKIEKTAIGVVSRKTSLGSPKNHIPIPQTEN
jgi:hypothetical protein